MKFGVVFPQTEIGTDPRTIVRFATTAEELGFDHVLAFDHVLGANTKSRPGWQGPYHAGHMFHEPFVLFSFLAGVTQTLEFVAGVIILPQRQTALVAKQAASLDVLSKGRFRLGVGVGWNPVEYEGLGQNFHDRGARIEEQIDVMRKLWAEETMTYDGRWHTITDAGINPLPIRRRIPIWLGGMAQTVIERVGRIGDGWFPFVNADLEQQVSDMRKHARAAGRNPDEIGIESMIPVSASTAEIVERVRRLQDVGATHAAGVTMNANLANPNAHIDAIKRFREKIAAIR